MAVELVRKPVTLESMTRKESVQVIKERDIIVPDGKPDMQNVVQLDSSVVMDQIDVSQDKVMYRGKINVNILYTAPNNPSCIYTMKSSIPIDDFMIMEGVDKEQRIDFKYDIEYTSYNILNERKVNVKAIMQNEVYATSSDEILFLTSVQTDAPIQTREQAVEIVSLAVEKEDKVIVKEDLTVAQNKPSIGEIIKSSVQIQEEQIKRTESEIKYNGIIEVTTMYKANNDETNIQIINHRVPFEGAIENLKNEEEVYWDCRLSVESDYMQITPDYDGEDRVIESEFVVTAKYAKYNRSEETLVSDIYCPGKKVAASERMVEYMTLFNRSELSIPKKDSVSIEEIQTENLEVFSVEIKPTVEEKVISDDKLTIRGMLELRATCLVNNEINSIETVVNVVPFSQEIDIRNISDKVLVIPNVTVKDTKLYAQTKKELVLDYLLDCTAEVYSKEEIKVLDEVTLEDMTAEELDRYPSMTIYQVRKGDSLWGIAKRFNTTVKEIQDINDIEVSENLKEGQKIIILKKVKF
ncbi:DUF3794 and LysM peptidoglycan-binding domain-containing protein [Cellulosilyticum ruminicola]|uniref:DUF3794 and LysM peptidoglycan-binding domain-containing protein n=1 Tax=Cellulosilyticum ruminicola TaxID=425254 RepID=UPI0006D18D56|nr:SPOCS domain-containing protein [Cellulosilyticum ruminicola]